MAGKKLFGFLKKKEEDPAVVAQREKAKAEIEKYKEQLKANPANTKKEEKKKEVKEEPKEKKEEKKEPAKQEKKEEVVPAPAKKEKKPFSFFKKKEKKPEEEKSFEDIVKESKKHKKKEKPVKEKDKEDPKRKYKEELVPETEDKGAQPHVKTKGFLGFGKKKVDMSKKSGKDIQKKIKQDIFKTIKYKKRIRVAKRKQLRFFLDKAGYEDVDEIKLKRTIKKISIIVSAALTVIVFLIALINGRPLTDPVIFMVGIWIGILPILIILIYVVIYIFLDFRAYKRKQELESVLADFLGLTSSNISAGMPVDKALWFAVRPKFGVLAKEIEEVAKSTLTGEDLAKALTKFSNKYDSVVLKRSVALLLEGMEGGGEIADLLTKISRNIQETRIMKKQMAADVLTYVIFISFATAVIAPFLFALSTQLLVIIQGIMSNIDTTASGSTIQFVADAVKLEDFKLFAIAMLLVSSMFSAFIIATIRKGSAREGLKYIPIFWIVVIVLYFVASAALGSLMGSFLGT